MLVQSMKEYSEASYNDESVLELLGATCALIRIVRSNTEVVQRYYTKYLHNAHAASLSVIVDAVKNGSLLPPDSVDILSGLVQQMDSQSTDFTQFRQQAKSLMGTMFASAVASQLRPKSMHLLLCHRCYSVIDVLGLCFVDSGVGIQP